MAHRMTKKDLALVDELREFGVLEDPKSHLLDQRRGVVLVACGDADRFGRIFARKVKMQKGQCADTRIHVIALNGGALRLAKKSPANKGTSRMDQYLMADIRNARRMKKIDTVALYIHAPCGQAKAARIDLRATIEILMAAKKRIKRMRPIKGTNQRVTVACFCHLAYPNGKDAVFFIRRDRWEAWLKYKQEKRRIRQTRSMRLAA